MGKDEERKLKVPCMFRIIADKPLGEKPGSPRKCSSNTVKFSVGQKDKKFQVWNYLEVQAGTSEW